MKLAPAFRLLLLVMALAASSIAARADVITSSLSLPVSDVATLFGPGDGNAQVFQTNAQFWSLTSIVVRAGNLQGNPIVFAQLRADDPVNDAPMTGVNNILTTFTIPDLTGPLSDRTFVPDSAVTLKPTHRYWFVLGTLSSDSANSIDWAFTDVNGPVTGPGKIPPRFAETFDAGGSWDTNHPSSFYDAPPFLIQVNGVALTGAAPEPPAVTLLAVAGVPAVGLFLRRRSRA